SSSPPAATTQHYTPSLHDALPISVDAPVAIQKDPDDLAGFCLVVGRCAKSPGDIHIGEATTVEREAAVDSLLGDVVARHHATVRSEEHTSELQSRENLVCRLLLEK